MKEVRFNVVNFVDFIYRKYLELVNFWRLEGDGSSCFGLGKEVCEWLLFVGVKGGYSIDGGVVVEFVNIDICWFGFCMCIYDFLLYGL